MLKNANESLRGWRGIIQAWVLTLLTYAEGVFNIASTLLSQANPIVTPGGWKYAAVVAAGVTLKNMITDVRRKQ